MTENLDLRCAIHAKKIADEVREEGTIGKALGVLQEDGVYAFFIYLLSLEQKRAYKGKAKTIIDQSAELLKKHTLIAGDDVNANNVTQVITPLANNLDQLLFAKELIERALIYARYHAKALGGD